MRPLKSVSATSVTSKPEKCATSAMSSVPPVRHRTRINKIKNEQRGVLASPANGGSHATDEEKRKMMKSLLAMLDRKIAEPSQ